MWRAPWAFSCLFPACFILLISGCKEVNPSLAGEKPDENRFTTTILTQPGELDEPMAFTFLDKENLVVVERKGNVKLFNTSSRLMKTIAHIPVNTKYVNKEGQAREAEEGLMGVIADPGFAQNHWVYLFYAHPDTALHVLARWDLKNDSLIEKTKKVVLEFPTQRELCCHTGGGMVFDKEGNLYLTTGNNTANPPQGTSNLDERPGMENHDDQRTSGNTDDLRGKILRIHPEPDGSYTIPSGNLFPENTPDTRPEIYTMGHRNPWRISIDSKTGYIYWGEVGPDASRDSSIGPRGYDEFNQAKKPGFFGWPYFIADNKAYADYDFVTNTLGPLFDTANVVNNSPNNTGLKKLPAPEKAFIWYPYSYSEEFPLLGSAGRSATGGPVFRKSDFPDATSPFPDYYEGKWLIVEFMRGWIMSVSMDQNGNYASMERFLPAEEFMSAIDIKFNSDGDLFVLEYGSAWFRGNVNAQIKRIEYNGGNRRPVVKAGADKIAGAIPLTVQLNSNGTMDFDGDNLTYNWNIRSENGYEQILTGTNPKIILEKAGVYQVSLTVSDDAKATNSTSFEIIAGNEPPMVQLEILKGNQSFFFPGNEIVYKISVEDHEDGKISSGDIPSSSVAVNFDYAPEGFDLIEIAQNHRSSDAWTTFSMGLNLINKSDCRSCHMLDKKSVGPSYLDIADKYKNLPHEVEKLAQKIISGGTGVWGEHAMSAHPNLSSNDATKMVEYIMSLTSLPMEPKIYPLEGSLLPEVPSGDNGRGGYLLRAAYTDRGANGLSPLTGEKIIALRNPVLNPEDADENKGTLLLTTPSRSFNIVEDGAYLLYQNLDISGIQSIEILAEASPRVGSIGGVIEVRLDTPDGLLLGKSEMIVPKEVDRRAIISKLREENRKAGKPDAPIDFELVQKLTASSTQIELGTQEGKHHIYLVFRNPEAKSGQILMQMQQIRFHQLGNKIL